MRFWANRASSCVSGMTRIWGFLKASDQPHRVQRLIGKSVWGGRKGEGKRQAEQGPKPDTIMIHRCGKGADMEGVSLKGTRIEDTG